MIRHLHTLHHPISRLPSTLSPSGHPYFTAISLVIQEATLRNFCPLNSRPLLQLPSPSFPPKQSRNNLVNLITIQRPIVILFFIPTNYGGVWQEQRCKGVPIPKWALTCRLSSVSRAGWTGVYSSKLLNWVYSTWPEPTHAWLVVCL